MSNNTTGGTPREVCLPEIVLQNVQFVDEAISAVFHTIIFVRAPTYVTVKDHKCSSLSPLVYPKCASFDIDQIISNTILEFRKSLNEACSSERSFAKHSQQAQPLALGEVSLSFFSQKEVKEYLGLFTRNENVCFEVWRLPIVLPLATITGCHAGSLQDGQRRRSTGSTHTFEDTQFNYAFSHVANQHTAQGVEQPVPTPEQVHSAYRMVQQAIMGVIQAANAPSDHVPLTMYDCATHIKKVTITQASVHNYTTASNIGDCDSLGTNNIHKPQHELQLDQHVNGAKYHYNNGPGYIPN